MLGLVEFMPALLLLPFTGSVADRFDRRRVAAIAFTLEIGVSLLLFLYATTEPTSAVPIFVLAAAVRDGPGLRAAGDAVDPAADRPDRAGCPD